MSSAFCRFFFDFLRFFALFTTMVDDAPSGPKKSEDAGLIL
jgi:hypothetical protein